MIILSRKINETNSNVNQKPMLKSIILIFTKSSLLMSTYVFTRILPFHTNY